MSSEDPTFEKRAVEEMLKRAWSGSTRINAHGLELATEYLRLFLLEALQRAAKEAAVDGDSVIEPEHIEKILPQLLLDF